MKRRSFFGEPSFTVERRSIPPDRREARKASRPSKSPEKPTSEPVSPMVADMARVPRYSTYGFAPDFWKPSKD